MTAIAVCSLVALSLGFVCGRWSVEDAPREINQSLYSVLKGRRR